MPDPFRHVRPGDDLQIPAQTFNTLMDVARDYKRNQHPREVNKKDEFRQLDIIKIRNEGGGRLVTGAILGLKAPIFLPDQNNEAALNAFKRQVAYRGTVPQKMYAGKFAVLIEPCDVGRIARGAVSGVCQVKVKLMDPSHTCCDVTPGVSDYLTSTKTGGSAQILWTPGYLKEPAWSTVRLGTNCAICCNGSSSSSSTSTSTDISCCGCVKNPETWNWQAHWSNCPFGETPPPDETGTLQYTGNQPTGVCAWQSGTGTVAYMYCDGSQTGNFHIHQNYNGSALPTIDFGDWNCCGSNTFFAPGNGSVCDLTITVSPASACDHLHLISG